MKTLFAAAVFGLLASTASAQMSPVGLWKTIDDETKKEKALVRVVENGGVVSGKIEKLLAADAKQDALCDKCEDDRKDKPIVGMEIIRNVKKDGDAWAGGTILDSAKGKVYKVKMTPIEAGKKLEVRGYVGAPMFGRTQTWHRVE
ncbi:MAG: DUF2147 domain-containing protein [Burkholderiales bacterium]|uniref:DUF2147 domain-containing protein n=1 Tax=Inhella sp. TaxID=1921806 RepID=UPI001AC7700C|nr:DUF2147 domain-containing protein [Burkholderiales bacterium]